MIEVKQNVFNHFSFMCPLVGKYHNHELTLTSPVIIVFGRLVMVVKVLDTIESSSVCNSWVECTCLQYVIAMM